MDYKTKKKEIEYLGNKIKKENSSDKKEELIKQLVYICLIACY